MTPSPISPLTVNIILQYILPPSQLSQPLPTHLISPSLLNRHHFLKINPNDPIEYLSWPSPNRQRAIDLLENLSMRIDDDEGNNEYDVRYTSDVEYTYAHVRLEEHARIIFQWDAEDGWKYHDTNLMPFPPGSQQSLQEVLADAVMKISQVDNPLLKLSLGGDDDDDEYWNAYGAHRDDVIHNEQEPQLLKAENSEDAYWAQYVSVHGSGDSTVPSPLSRKLHHAPHLHSQPLTPPTPDYDQNQSPVPIPIPRSKIHDKLEPPSPHTLTERLRAISFRENHTQPTSVAPDTPFHVVPEPKIKHNVTNWSHAAVIPAKLCSPNPSYALFSPDTRSGDAKDSEEDEAALKESIRSVYRLWKMSRRTGSEDDGETFLRVTREVVGLP